MPQTFLITGASRGIGRRLTEILLVRGDRVIATVREAGALNDLKEEAGERLTVLELDVRDHAAVDALIGGLGRPVDVLINNAGVIGPERSSTLDMDFEGFADTLAVNTLAPLKVAQAALPVLEKAERPRIITISSWMGSHAGTGSDRIAYRASKAAVNRVMQGLAADVRPRGIAVLMMHPGWVRTDMGGGNATLSVGESAAGIIAVADALTLNQTGRFLNYSGQAMDW